MPIAELDYSTFASRLQINLYQLYQNHRRGYDTYDSCIVAAYSEETAKLMHPQGGELNDDSEDWPRAHEADYIKCELIGQAVAGTVPGVILASLTQVNL